MTEDNTQAAECLSRLTAELGTTSDEQQLAAAVMPCGAVVSNVYEAYEAGVKAECERRAQEPQIDNDVLKKAAANMVVGIPESDELFRFQKQDIVIEVIEAIANFRAAK